MSDLADRLADIQKRSETAANGNFIDRAIQEHEVINHDVPFLLDLARKQQATIDALSKWAGKNKAGYYDEAQDDVVQIIRPALEAKP